ncbi:hypothetical protein H1Z61_03200 [Bacillus aquiflavi]|uniref:Uncharacterized protein n=1 Tax=Bacillus aquiflavi TaxID=2672567 RepID=A0A6B3VYU6_9BACI|nr:hypothetical protein [Bacillus aquiflavi]MBA4536171.1 hypothetical protein [Bacillus aquiflavi]NEY80544.1 hypothetical protein [Bacillus aquiflavi]
MDILQVNDKKYIFNHYVMNHIEKFRYPLEANHTFFRGISKKLLKDIFYIYYNNNCKQDRYFYLGIILYLQSRHEYPDCLEELLDFFVSQFLNDKEGLLIYLKHREGFYFYYIEDNNCKIYFFNKNSEAKEFSLSRDVRLLYEI